MPMTTPPRLTTINYQQDTLFGVNALACECLVQVTEPGELGAGSLQLLVDAPWPEQLQHAHGLTFDRDGHPCHGVVRHGRRLANAQLLLVLELQPGPIRA
ncbi:MULTISPECIES: hypothetical protein [Pseudomonas]|uniref:Uncharacterized protein n=1 Tax=Pseudomonas piscis TaxID=2614538 RepID=A0ABY9NR41_9PSED|nr:MULTISPECIES: hypothetical protein [Pseudomonas]POA52509.1 hypothetical protein C1889_22015 [Pseudomonas sp. FW507-12TSA]WMN20729.1 hypothetical protein QL104_15420 [Pseudomonas piscis]